MKLYDLLKKISQENNEIYTSTINAYKAEKEVLAKTQSLLSTIEKQFKQGNMSEEEYKIQKNAIEIRKNEKVKEIRATVKQESKYAEALSGLRDSRAYISNSMLLALLKASTGKEWTFEEEIIPPKNLESDHPISTLNLVLKNKTGERYIMQKGFLDDRFGPEYTRITFSCKNWFQEFLSSTQCEGKIYLSALGGNGLEMPKPVVKALCDFFKRVDVKQKDPSSLSFEDRRNFGKQEDFKPHNLYYRFMKDQKAQNNSNKNNINKNKIK